MLSASGNDFILMGAKPEDISVVKSILDGYVKFEVTPGNVVSFEYICRSLKDFQDFVIDLREDGLAKVRYAGDTREGLIAYNKHDLKRLLEQLTLMVSGQRWKELDYEDIITILEKKCLFKWADSSDSGIVENSLSAFKELIENEESDKEVKVLFQFSDCKADSVNEFFDGMEELESDIDITAYDQEVHCWDNSMIEPDEDTYGIVSIFYPV